LRSPSVTARDGECGCIQLPRKVAEWAEDILKESLEEETDFHEAAVERLKQDSSGSSGT
jgi:hypothetical protein